VFEATFNGQNKDSEKSKAPRKCLYGKLHKFINCPYLFIEVYKLGWNPKQEIEKKVKKALAKAYNGIKAALKRAKAKLEKDSTSTLTLGSPTTINKPGNFAAQHCAKPGSFMLAHKTLNTSTPESHLQGTPYKSTDLLVVLDPLGADPNSLGITTQLVKSPKSSAFRVMGTNTDL
jgi:hypothetical protein